MIDVAAVEAICGSPVTAMTPLHGGDVARSYRVELSQSLTVFAKTHPDPPPGFFVTEAVGLEWLREAGTLPVPEVIGVSDEPPLLVLEWIEQAQRPPADEKDFGRGLARLHNAGAACFGREDGRTTGSRGLPNDPCPSWAEFYAERRLRPLAALAADGHALPTEALAGLEQVADRLAELGGEPEPPARLHGDLWAGNRIVDRGGRSWLIDPACHGGHREFDLAMMRLFGGFDERCFSAYQQTAPLADGWSDRILLHQLAPLVVHAIKFGGGYVGAACEAIDRYR